MPMRLVLPVDVDFGYCREKIKLTGNEWRTDDERETDHYLNAVEGTEHDVLIKQEEMRDVGDDWDDFEGGEECMKDVFH